ncbi:MAG: 16S rRNA (adenine(1518)-N(6)/adenine(1519)-N(6))-dimethyltransferase RsmA [Proteobacteria bacterium]|nr:16S rRNA (adenine(1518)-N(6)/adenine(1519)-N(6))-dimethyltransferase RsmA [Pseudomonadota bacterium]
MLKKSLSQNLIKDKNLLRKIVHSANITKEDVVVEIGAGHGDLTAQIAEKAGYLFTIELDSSFAQYLDQIENKYNNVKVIYGDCLKIPLAQFRKEKNIKIVANIPYKITGPIIFKILSERSIVDSAFLTVQKEIAQRIVSNSHCKTYGAPSVDCQIFADVKVLFYIKARVFIPPPKVDSALLSIVFKENEKETDDELIDFIRNCFQNKRKQLKNSLIKRYGEQKTDALYESMGFPYYVRAEEIEPYQFKEIYYFLKDVEN